MRKSNFLFLLPFLFLNYNCGPASHKGSIPITIIGQPFEAINDKIAYDKIQKNNNVWTYFNKGSRLLTIHDKGGGDQVIRDVEIFSKEVSLEDGIRAGMTIKSLFKKYPAISLVLDPESGHEYISINDLETTTAEGKPKVVVKVMFHSYDGRSLAVGELKYFEPAKNFRKEGVVDKIIVYDWR